MGDSSLVTPAGPIARLDRTKVVRQWPRIRAGVQWAFGGPAAGVRLGVRACAAAPGVTWDPRRKQAGRTASAQRSAPRADPTERFQAPRCGLLLHEHGAGEADLATARTTEGGQRLSIAE